MEPSPPGIAARSALLLDARDGQVLFRRAETARRSIASATKLMTALLAFERLELGRRLRAAPYAANPVESQIGLGRGERMAVRDLLIALLLESANDAAVTLARGAAGSVRRFVRLMNRRAKALGLADSHFENPIGLDEPGNYSSAADLASLARRLLVNDVFATIVDLPRGRLATGARTRVIDNRNSLVGRVGWINGIKTGHTLDAGYVLIGSGRRKGAQLVSVVLGEPSEARRDADTLALLRFGFALYRRETPVRRGQELAQARVAFYGDREVALLARRSLGVTLRRGQRARTVIEAPGELDGPLRRGARVGRVRVLVGDRVVATTALVTAEGVSGASTARKVLRWMLRPGALLALAAIVLLAGARLRRQRGLRPPPRPVP
jgi:D-alanyl-D-alanine carboxypeptidase (penicillin-binding protein 5/6)